MSRLEAAGFVATFCVLMFIVIAAIHVEQQPSAPAPQRTSSTSMPSYCEGQVRVFPGLGVAYDPTCVAPAP